MKTFLFGLLIAVLVAFEGCDGGSEGDSSSSVSSSAASSSSSSGQPVRYGALIGVVKDADSRQPIGNTSVRIGTQAVLTNEQGYFTVDRLGASEHRVVSFEKNGYVPTAERVVIREGVTGDIEVYMRRTAVSQTVSAQSGGTVGNGGASVTIGGGDLINADGTPFRGTAQVSLTPFDPTTEAGLDAFPGDFEGVKADGTKEPLMSYGYVDITVSDGSGNPLQLREGATAQIRIPIPLSLQADAPATMPLWWFDPSDGQWHETGTMRRDGTVYTGEIEHFSIYNSDVGYSRSFVKGRLLNCRTQEPISCGRIDIRGISPRNCWKSGETCTAEDGRFDRIPVDADSVFELVASKNGIRSVPQQLTAMPKNGTLDVGDICVDTASIRITLTWGAEPSDLDAHLTFDNASGVREMVYYGVEKSSDESVRLNTDDTDGYGPEIVSVYALHDGVYRYSVHQFSGMGTMKDGNVVLNMTIERGNGTTEIYRLTPPATAGYRGDNDVWTAWDIVVRHGSIEQIKTINTVKHGILDSDIPAFSP